MGLDPNAGEYANIVEQKGFLCSKTGNRQGNTQGRRVMQRQRLDTKQEPENTETNKTQVDTMRQGNSRAGQNQQQGGTAVAVTQRAIRSFSRG